MLISSFLTYLQLQKRYSAHTLLAYQTDLSHFEAFIAKEFELSLTQVNFAQLRTYLVAIIELKLSANTASRKIAAIRSFYKFLLSQAIISTNPTLLIKTPKKPKRLPVFIEDHNLDTLLDSDEIFNNSFSSCRDKIVLELLFGTGMRLEELLRLTETDLNFYENTLKVLGKRNKERIIPIHTPLVSQLKNYLNLKLLQNFNNKSTVLIVTDKGLAAYPKQIYRIVNCYLTYISTQNKKSPHVLRHSFATSLLNKGADLNAIKELLGHASLAATQVYTHNSIERLKLIYKQAHPKA